MTYNAHREIEGGTGNDIIVGNLAATLLSDVAGELLRAAGEKQIVNIPADQIFWRMAA